MYYENLFELHKEEKNHLWLHHLEIITLDVLIYILTDHSLAYELQEHHIYKQITGMIYVLTCNCFYHVNEQKLQKWSHSRQGRPKGSREALGKQGCARPHLDGTRTLRLCQLQTVTPVLLLSLGLLSLLPNLATCIGTYPSHTNVSYFCLCPS